MGQLILLRQFNSLWRDKGGLVLLRRCNSLRHHLTLYSNTTAYPPVPI